MALSTGTLIQYLRDDLNDPSGTTYLDPFLTRHLDRARYEEYPGRSLAALMDDEAIRVAKRALYNIIVQKANVSAGIASSYRTRDGGNEIEERYSEQQQKYLDLADKILAELKAQRGMVIGVLTKPSYETLAQVPMIGNAPPNRPELKAVDTASEDDYSDEGVTVRWYPFYTTVGPDVQLYRVWIRPVQSPSASWELYTSSSLVDQTTVRFGPEDLDAGVTYEVRVEAIDFAGLSADSFPVQFIAPAGI